MTFRITHIILFVALVLCSCSVHRQVAGAGLDNFDGAEGSHPNAATWDYDPGNPANHELQNYTDSTENVRLDGEGHLAIQALRSGNRYTSVV